MSRIILKTTFCLLAGLSLGGCVTARAPQQVAPARPTASEIPSRPVRDSKWLRFSVMAELPADSLPDALEVPPLAAAPGDLLERVRAGYALPGVEHAAIDRELAWYSRHQSYLDRVFGRAALYLPHIVDEIERRQLPLELALLPVVESAFDPFAYSHGRASGLWQFIPGTGRRYGLKQNWWYDGRRDVIESTRAALDYLSFLAQEFDGDWLLAVAAYNTGERNVARAISRNRSAGKPTDFFNLRLPRETRSYVPRLLAIARLVGDPEKHGVTLPSITDAPTFVEVDTGGQIDLAVAAELSGLVLEDIYTLNPGFNRWATDPDGPHRLLLPVERGSLLQAALVNLPSEERVQWTHYRIRPGDTLSTIANRHSTSVSFLKEINGLRGNTIRAGADLLIPRSRRSPAGYSHTVDARVARVVAKSRPGSKRRYVVRPGDTLWEIARRHSVSARELASWNGMASRDVLRVGRELVIWQPEDTPTVAANGNAEGMVRRIDYVVRRGDSLWKLSSRFKVALEALLKWNDLSSDSVLRPGDRLVMFVDVTNQWGG